MGNDYPLPTPMHNTNPVTSPTENGPAIPPTATDEYVRSLLQDAVGLGMMSYLKPPTNGRNLR